MLQDWLDSRNLDLRFPDEPGRKRLGSVTATTARFENQSVFAERFELGIVSETDVVKTSLTAMEVSGKNFVWIDKDRWLVGPFGSIESVEIPDLVGMVLHQCKCRIGNLSPTVEPVFVAENEATELIQTLFDPDRHLPLALAQPGPFDSQEDFARKCALLQDRLLGLASVQILHRDAADQVNRAVGELLKVGPGVVRSFMPGLLSSEDDPKRHRSIPGNIFARSPSSAATRLQRPLVARATSQPLPRSYTELVATAPGFPEHVQQGDEELVDELISHELMLTSIEDELSTTKFLLELTTEEFDEASRDLENSQARVAWLETALRKHGDETANKPTPEGVVDNIESCRDAVDRARQFLPSLDIADTDQLVDELDSCPRSAIWGRKSWQALQTLDEFAQMKLAGEFDGNFYEFCRDGIADPGIATSWVAMKESESVDNDARLKSARMFPIVQDDEEVDVYMCAHIKVDQVGNPVPRIHFYDNCDGPTKKIHIGYFGKHLPLPT